MPELPEVEVTRRAIAPLLVGRRIKRITTTRPSYFFITPPALLERRLQGRRVIELSRIGKYLLAELDDRAKLLLHLGMTGQLFSSSVHSPRLLSKTARSALSPEAQQSFCPDAHTHLKLEFTDRGDAIFFRDVRKFGKVALLPPGASDPRLDKLGPDALGVDGELLSRAARSRRCALKTFLLDQSVIAGVGNIYADEALFLVGLRPGRSVHRVPQKAWEPLAQAVRRVLLRSIETGGSSISDYLQPNGADGGFQDERRVYSRTGEPCHACGTAIRRLVIGARSSHFCPNCQR